MAGLWEKLLDKRTGVLSNYCLDLINKNGAKEKKEISDLARINEVILEDNQSVINSIALNQIENITPIIGVLENERQAA